MENEHSQIPTKLQQEMLRIRQDIISANTILAEAFHRQDRLAEQAQGSSLANLLAASGVSLAAERLKLLYKREAELELEIREALLAICDQEEVDSRVTLLLSETA